MPAANAASRSTILLRSLIGLDSRPDEAVRGYEADFADWFGPDQHAVAFDRGRTAMLALLHAAGLRCGDEVVISAYTCHSVPAALHAAGLQPVMVDMDPATYGTDAASFAAALTARTRAVIVQHSYGWSADLDGILSVARPRGIAVLEDCCQSLGTRSGGRWLGTLADGAFFSSQWNKHYNTAFGGMALLRNADAAAQMCRRRDERAAAPGFLQRRLLAAELLAFEWLMFPRSAALLTALFRGVTRLLPLPGGESKAAADDGDGAPGGTRSSSLGVESPPSSGAATGSSTDREVELPPQVALAALQADLGRLEVARLHENIAHRRNSARRVLAALRAMDHHVPADAPNVELSPLRIPVRVADPAAAIAAARRHGFELTTWFDVPLDPLNGWRCDPHYRPGACPRSERAAREVVLIPLGRRVTDAVLTRIERFFAGWPRYQSP